MKPSSCTLSSRPVRQLLSACGENTASDAETADRQRRPRQHPQTSWRRHRSNSAVSRLALSDRRGSPGAHSTAASRRANVGRCVLTGIRIDGADRRTARNRRGRRRHAYGRARIHFAHGGGIDAGTGTRRQARHDFRAAQCALGRGRGRVRGALIFEQAGDIAFSAKTARAGEAGAKWAWWRWKQMESEKRQSRARLNVGPPRRANEPWRPPFSASAHRHGRNAFLPWQMVLPAAGMDHHVARRQYLAASEQRPAGARITAPSRYGCAGTSCTS